MIEQRGEVKKRRDSLQFYGRKNSIFVGLRNMVPEEQQQQQHEKTPILKLVRDPLFYKPIRVGCILMMIQQFSGIRKDFLGPRFLQGYPIWGLLHMQNHAKVLFNFTQPLCLSQLEWKIRNSERLLLEF